MTPTAHDKTANGVKHLRAVLLVEDDPNDVELAEREFGKMKLRNPVLHTSTVEEMIQYMLGEGQYADRTQFPLPALIMLDMHLFTGDGLDAAAWLRSKLKFRSIPIIAISGSGTERLNSAVAMGADALMVKPMDGEEFRKIVSRLNVPLQFQAS
jgi:CheY-like chemotaxis protein